MKRFPAANETINDLGRCGLSSNYFYHLFFFFSKWMFEKWKPKNSPLLLFSDIRQTRWQI